MTSQNKKIHERALMSSANRLLNWFRGLFKRVSLTHTTTLKYFLQFCFVHAIMRRNRRFFWIMKLEKKNYLLIHRNGVNFIERISRRSYTCVCFMTNPPYLLHNHSKSVNHWFPITPTSLPFEHIWSRNLTAQPYINTENISGELTKWNFSL